MSVKNKLYPHLLREEIPIWERFLDRHGEEYKRFDYDVRIGESYDPPKDVELTYQEMGILLGKKRIDVVGWSNDMPTIFEVKRRAGLSAIGQLISYTILWQWEPGQYLSAGGLIVCEEVMPDVRRILDVFALGIMVV